MEPKITQANYISYMVTPYHYIFRSLGYPELDIVEFPDGEWLIAQYHRSPVVPCLTPWSSVLSRLRHVEKTEVVFRKFTEQLDLEKKHIWAECAERERLAEEQARRDDDHQIDFQKYAFKYIRGNDDLMQRISRKGLGEMKLRNISRNIPNHFFRRA